MGLFITAEQAYKERLANSESTLFVYVRTRAELEFVGMTQLIDINIPYMVHDTESWNENKNRFVSEPNSNFTIAFEKEIKDKGLNKNSKIIMMCRSGSRSAKAVNLISKLGYSNVYTVVDGFEGDKAKSGDKKGQRVVSGWQNSDLPWSYKLTMAKMYFKE